MGEINYAPLIDDRLEDAFKYERADCSLGGKRYSLNTMCVGIFLFSFLAKEGVTFHARVPVAFVPAPCNSSQEP